MGLRSAGVVVLTLLVLGAVAVSAVESVAVTSLTGSALIEPEGAAVAEGDALAEGQTITLAEGAHMTLTFADGSYMDLSGPARFRLTEVTDQYRTVDLVYGTINQLVVLDVVTGVRTPYDTLVAVLDSTVSVTVTEMDERARVTYVLLEGTDAKVLDGRVVTLLSSDAPMVVDRDRRGGMELPGTGTGVPAIFQLGEHKVLAYPRDGFIAEPQPGGGLKIVRTASGFGMVTVDEGTSFYLSEGEYVTFDANGNVIGHNGIIHVYAPLDYQGLYDDPIDGPASASPTGTTIR